METLFIGKNLVRLKRVDSTNNYAAGLLRHSGSDGSFQSAKTSSYENTENKIFEGTVVIAEFQEKGRGQRGNTWKSDEGKNLTASIILNPVFLKPDQQFLLTKITSLAICDLLKSLGVRGISIKWPNDILVQGKKISGVLIENTLRSNEITHSIIGIGLNVNQVKFENNLNAASLKEITGKTYEIDDCLSALCSFLEARYLRLKSDRSSADMDYLSSLYQLNQWKDYLVRDEKIFSVITGITPHGLLRLQKENGAEILCDLKEVSFL